MSLTDENKRVIDVVAMEYSALRAEILHRSGTRFTLLSVGLGVFPLLVALLDNSDQIFTPRAWPLLTLYLLIVLACFFNEGRAMGRLASRLVEIEGEINSLADGSAPLLKWETEQQKRRGLFGRLLLGWPPLGAPTVN
jgi:hypothetical protein